MQLQILHCHLHFHFRMTATFQIKEAKSICNCISHVLRVMILSYLNTNINYHVCFSTLSAPRINCQISNGIAILFALNFLYLHLRCQSIWGGGTILGGLFVLGGDVAHRRPCRMLWLMEIISKGSAKDSSQSVRAGVRTDSATFLAQYIILSFLPPK